MLFSSEKLVSHADTARARRDVPPGRNARRACVKMQLKFNTLYREYQYGLVTLTLQNFFQFCSVLTPSGTLSSCPPILPPSLLLIPPSRIPTFEIISFAFPEQWITTPENALQRNIKVGTHDRTSSCNKSRDKSHRVNWPFLLQNLLHRPKRTTSVPVTSPTKFKPVWIIENKSLWLVLQNASSELFVGQVPATSAFV